MGVDAWAVAVAAGGGGDVALLGIKGGVGETAAVVGVGTFVGRVRRVSAGAPGVARAPGESARGGGAPLERRGWPPTAA